MKSSSAFLFYLFVTLCNPLSAQQPYPENLSSIDLAYNEQYAGFNLFKTPEKRLFILAENWHTIQQTPAATLKFLKYLHEEAGVRILAIEHGYSVAYLINQYLDTRDTTLLRQINKNSMYWGKENLRFLQELARFNEELSLNERINVASIDIEYKLEAPILVINKLIEQKEVSPALFSTVGEFKRIFVETREHRDQFDGLNVQYYYDLALVTDLVDLTLEHLNSSPSVYQDFFGADFAHFSIMINDLKGGIYFDYTNDGSHYKFRDDIIYERFVTLAQKHPDVGILCAIGIRHLGGNSSVKRLQKQSDSPLLNQVLTIRITALNKRNRIWDHHLRSIDKRLNGALTENDAALIKHDKSIPLFKAAKSYDYTLFINNNRRFTPLVNSYYGEK